MGLHLLLAIPLQAPTSDTTLQGLFSVINQLPTKNRITIPSSWVQSTIERVGQLYIPAEQERPLEEVVHFLEQAPSFWDFSDHGAFFFLADRTSPTRFYTTHHVITGDDQREVVNDLTLRPPQYILYRSNTGWDAIAGVDRTLRTDLIADFLLRNYHPIDSVGGFNVLERGAPPSFPTGSPFRVDLGSVPLLWGQDEASKQDLPDSAKASEWSFSLTTGLMGWESENDIPLLELFQEGLHLRTGGTDPELQN